MQIQLKEHSATIDAIKADRELSRLARSLPVTKRNTVRPTVAFLQSVAKWLESIGLVGCTITAAWQFWIAQNEYARIALEANKNNAELAYWFGIDPTALDETQRLGFMQSLPSVQCQERIQRGDFGADDYKGIYNLFLTAFGDEELARKMQTEAFKLYVEKCTKLGKGV